MPQTSTHATLLLPSSSQRGNLSGVAPRLPPLDPPQTQGVQRGSPGHPNSTPPRLQGPSPTLRELPHPSSPGGRAPESSFPGAWRELGLFCSHHFLINSLFLRDEWTRAVLCLVLARPRDAAAQRRYLLGPFQGLCHAAWSLGIFARLPPQIGPENLAMPSLENKQGNRGAGGVWAKPGWCGQSWDGVAVLGLVSQPERKFCSWILFLGMAGDGPRATAASSCPGDWARSKPGPRNSRREFAEEPRREEAIVCSREVCGV